MSNLTMTPTPGYYETAPQASFVFGADVDYISFTQNGAQPTNSEYIAYDQLTPPNPFLAVTQDGRGNVVYDGGFPKFYNNRAPGSPFAFNVLAFSGVLNSPAAAGGNYIYDKFSNVSLTVQAGWTLEFEIFTAGPIERASINATVSGSLTRLHDFPSSSDRQIVDQAGKPIHADTDLGGLSVGKWYKRTFSLTPVAGRTLSEFCLAFEGDVKGVYTAYFKNIVIKDQNSIVQGILYSSAGSTSIDVPLMDALITSNTYIQVTKALLAPTAYAAEHKFLRNALSFTANPTKDKNILLLGDKTASVYWVKGNSANDFWTSLSRLAHADGWNLIAKDSSDYGGTLNPTLTELNNYAAVIVVSSVSNGSALITNQAVADLITYREAGNGLIVITDDGRNVADITAASTFVNGDFFSLANKIVVNFGAWFSGNYNRSPVNVGFLRSTYGDHALYAGMLDTENIYAGGSESRVFVAEYAKIRPTDPPVTVAIPNDARTVVRALVVMKDGTTELLKFVYSTGTDKLLSITDVFGRQLLASLDAGFGDGVQVSSIIDGAGVGTINGSIFLDNQRVGLMYYDETLGSSEYWFIGAPWRLRPTNGAILKYQLVTPFEYTKTFTISRKQAAVPTRRSLPDMVNALKAGGWSNVPWPDVIRRAFASMTNVSPWLSLPKTFSSAVQLAHLRAWFAGDKELPPLYTNIFATNAETLAYRQTTKKTPLELLGDGGRFQGSTYYPPGQPNPTNNWSLSLSSGSIVLTAPNDAEGWSGFLGAQKMADYRIDCVVSATGSKDQAIALILGFVNDTGNFAESNSLMLQIHRGGAYPQVGMALVVGQHHFKTTMSDAVPPQDARYKVIAQNTAIPISQPNAGQGWNGDKIRLRVIRDQNRLTIMAGQPTTGTPTLDNATLMEVDLSADPMTQPFSKACQIGVASQRQPNVTISSFTVQGGKQDDLIVDVSMKRLHRRGVDLNGWGIVTGATPLAALGAPRRIINPDTGKSWLLNKDNTFTPLG